MDDDRVVNKADLLDLEIPDELLQQCLEQGFLIDTGTEAEDGSPVYVFTDDAINGLRAMMEEGTEE